MSQKIFLKLGAGNLQDGFQQISFVLEKNGKNILQEQGALPGNSQLQDFYNLWQFGYGAFYDSSMITLRNQPRGIEIEESGIEGFSTISFPETCKQLQQCMQDWLASPSFSRIGDQMRLEFHRDDEIVIVIETADEFIPRLPWHVWGILNDFNKAEIVFSLQTYQCQNISINRSKLRILAVFGDITGLDLEADRRFVGNLKAEFVALEQPSSVELSQKLDEPQGWDLLFFAGHSSEAAGGSIQIEPRPCETKAKTNARR